MPSPIEWLERRRGLGLLNLLARAGLPVPEGEVLTRKAHEECLRASSILRDIREPEEAPPGEWRRCDPSSYRGRWREK